MQTGRRNSVLYVAMTAAYIVDVYSNTIRVFKHRMALVQILSGTKVVLCAYRFTRQSRRLHLLATGVAKESFFDANKSRETKHVIVISTKPRHSTRIMTKLTSLSFTCIAAPSTTALLGSFTFLKWEYSYFCRQFSVVFAFLLILIDMC